MVDNCSTDGTVSILRSETDATLVESNRNLGYAGGINLAFPLVGDSKHVLILNPDLMVKEDALTYLLDAATEKGVGAVVPLMLDGADAIYPALYREPSVLRSLCDAIFTRGICARLGLPSESDIRLESYAKAHDVDGATGAALLVPIAVARGVGEWNEEFFLYSEEVDYFRRIRAQDLRIRFEPAAVVRHRQGGSGTSPTLEALKAVNRVRYVGLHHGRFYTAMYRATVVLRHSLRSYSAVHRLCLATVINRRRWRDLPHTPNRPNN